MTTIDQLKQLIHEQFDVAPDTIDPDAPFASYNLDSLTVAELMFAIDDQFHVEIPDSAATTVTTLRGLAELLDGLVAAKSGVPATASV
ncbi:MAG: acyl carrier protein [Leptothrix sp. (in: b-proteobacteria)]